MSFFFFFLTDSYKTPLFESCSFSAAAGESYPKK
jgi:hypothetical protein